MDSDRGASDTDLAQDRQPTLLPDIVPVSIMDPPAVASSLTHSTLDVTLDGYPGSSQTGPYSRALAPCLHF